MITNDESNNPKFRIFICFELDMNYPIKSSYLSYIPLLSEYSSKNTRGVSMINAFLLIVLLPTFSYAIEIEFSPEVTQTFKPTNCENNSTCDLEKFKMTTQTYKVKSGGIWRHGSRAFISFQTDKVENIRNYGVVQFIKGCVYTSKLDQNGEVIQRVSISREFYGGYELFSHPNWVIDSIDEDPLYNSYDPEIDRFGAYRWSPTPGIFTNYDEQVYLLEKDPLYPEVYVTDRPAQAYVDSGVAKNISLQFKTCLYRTDDIPLKSIPTDTQFAKPIKCFDWNSQFKYDHFLGQFSHKNEISDICTEKI